jgi:copper chaperone CopZ
MQKKKFHVTGMHCPNCAMRIEGLEDELEGVAEICASYRAESIEVEYDQTKITPERIAAAVTALGYPTLPSPNP